MWIGKEDYVIRKSEYYDEDDDICKVLTASDIVLLDKAGKKYMALRMVIINEQNGRKSVMTLDKVAFNPEVKDDYFSLDYLEKL